MSNAGCNISTTQFLCYDVMSQLLLNIHSDLKVTDDIKFNYSKCIDDNTMSFVHKYIKIHGIF